MRYAPLAVVLLCAAGEAQAIALQIFGGSRSSTFEPEAADAEEGGSSSSSSSSPENDESLAVSDKFSGMEFGLAALVQPLPLVPVSFGISGITQHLKGKNGGADLKEEVKGFVLGGDLVAWLELGVVQPFARFSYDLYSSHKYIAEFQAPTLGVAGGTSTTELEMQGRVRGYHGGIGLRFRSTPAIGAFIQMDFAKETLTIDRTAVMQDGFGWAEDVNDYPDIQLNSQSFLIGVDLGT